MTVPKTTGTEATPLRPGLLENLAHVRETCTDCGLCRDECGFLQRYGTPGQIARDYDPSPAGQSMPFACSLCRLCQAVCPVGVKPATLFLEMRREAVERGFGSFPEHKGLLAYERTGMSRRFTFYGLPEGCTTVLFPGCAFPGTRPARTKEVFERLRTVDPALGIVLDCCGRISQGLGREAFTQAMFADMRTYLTDHGVREVIVVCPNCYDMFREYGEGLRVRMIYEALPTGGQTAPPAQNTVLLHDPCATRFHTGCHTAVRVLLASAGIVAQEMDHTREMTLCCGSGAGVDALAPDLARQWLARATGKDKGKGSPPISHPSSPRPGGRGQIAARGSVARRSLATDPRAAFSPLSPDGERGMGDRGDPSPLTFPVHTIATYCAGCAQRLGTRALTVHVLDILCEPEAALAGKCPAARAPWTYLNRLRLKGHFKKTLPVAASRERTFRAGEKARGTGRLLLLAGIIAAIIAARATGMTELLDQERLRGLIQQAGAMAPLIYMLIYAIAPSLMLPGLPITIVGGILFGPFWGVVYAITGATTGACLAFLIARYAARGWVAGKLTGARLKRLDEEVERQGWKIVAFTRLIPLFPFNLLNYAFGLTSIGFIPYAMTSFVCMLPACIAYIIFSSSLLDLFQGRISANLLIGIALIALVALIPVGYRKFKNIRKE